MKQYTIAEYAKLIGASTTTVYRRCSTVLNSFHQVLNGQHCLVFPDNIDPMTLTDRGEVFNGRSTDVQQNVEDVEQRSTGVQHGEPPADAARITALEAEVKRLADLLEVKEDHLKDLRDHLDYEKKSNQELHELLYRQQALTKQLEAPKAQEPQQEDQPQDQEQQPQQEQTTAKAPLRDRAREAWRVLTGKDGKA